MYDSEPGFLYDRTEEALGYSMNTTDEEIRFGEAYQWLVDQREIPWTRFTQVMTSLTI